MLLSQPTYNSGDRRWKLDWMELCEHNLRIYHWLTMKLCKSTRLSTLNSHIRLCTDQILQFKSRKLNWLLKQHDSLLCWHESNYNISSTLSSFSQKKLFDIQSKRKVINPQGKKQSIQIDLEWTWLRLQSSYH